MALYSSESGLDCHRVRFVLAEKGINVDIVYVSTDESAAADLAELNPYNETPTLVDRDLVLYLFGTPGQKRFDFMWEILSEGMLGFVVLVDSVRPETFREARRILDIFRSYANTPYVVAANKQDMDDAWSPEDLRIALKVRPDVKLLPCVAIEKESVKNVLLELLYSISDAVSD